MPSSNHIYTLAAKKWIFTIATHLIFDYFEACDRLKTVSLEGLEQRFRAGDMSVTNDWHTIEQLSTLGAEEVVCSMEESREKMEESRKKLELITEALSQVPGQLGKCFYMKYVQNLPHQEIAKTLRISESAARAYSSRGRQAVIKAVARLSALQEGRI